MPKIIITKGFPIPKNYAGLTIIPCIIFIKKEYHDDKQLINHENIHSKQLLELAIIPQYILYAIFYTINIIKYKFNHDKAYRNIPFEKEAYTNQNNLNYTNQRKHYEWIKYI